MSNIDYQKFVKNIEELKKQNPLDLSSDEDLSIAIMNLVSIEEHFFFTAQKTGQGKYFDLLSQVRKMRKDLLAKIVKNKEGEIWCISKHLLAASMRLYEVGTKYFQQDKKNEAHKLFQKAYELYSLFWGINLELIDTGKIKKIDENQINLHDSEEKSSLLSKLGKIVSKAIDCCRE